MGKLSGSAFVDIPLFLVTPTGGRHRVVVDAAVLQDYGYAADEAREFKIGDLREYVFDEWSTIVAGTEHVERPAAAEQIQLLHFGKRLDPNGCLGMIDVETSPVFHLVVRDPAAVGATGTDPGTFGRARNPVKLLRTAAAVRGKRANEPVPAFTPTHARSASRKSVPTTDNNVAATATATATPTEKEKTSVSSRRRAPAAPVATTTTTTTLVATADTPKHPCCAIM